MQNALNFYICFDWFKNSTFKSLHLGNTQVCMQRFIYYHVYHSIVYNYVDL